MQARGVVAQVHGSLLREQQDLVHAHEALDQHEEGDRSQAVGDGRLRERNVPVDSAHQQRHDNCHACLRHHCRRLAQLVDHGAPPQHWWVASWSAKRKRKP